MGVVVHIDKFSGPMALLLHLIRKEEMDIFDINIQEITKQYLDSIKAMKKLNLELAGDFIAMAATLIQIKSKMLLPQYNESGEEIESEDPRRDLVQRLIEYQMYQEAGQNLYARNLVGRNLWLRGTREEIRPDTSEILIEEENALYALISTYRLTIKKMKKAVHRVASSLQSIADRIWQMRELLVVGRTTTLSQLVVCGPSIENADELIYKEEKKGRLLITFLSLLELAKMGLVHVFQGENFADIHVDTRANIDKDSISNVENYESQIGNKAQASSDIWLDKEDHAEDVEVPLLKYAEEQLDEGTELTASLIEVGAGEANEANKDSKPEVAPATDEEIEIEERRLYGEQNEIS